MRALNLLRSAPMRLALAFTGISAVVMGVLLVVIYWSMIGLLERHLDNAVGQQLQTLKNVHEQDGRDAMLGLVSRQLGQHNGSASHVLVLDKAGGRIAGDLPGLSPVEGWQDITMPGTARDDETKPLRARGRWFDPETFVLVAHGTGELTESRELVVRSFAWALGVTVALALGGGLFIGGALLRRVDSASGSARVIMEGDLSRRIPTAGRGDELDRLTDGFNRMLERIEELMENLKHVTAGVAHDLRTPLGRLRQRLEAARVKPRPAAEYEATIDGAIDNVDAIIKTFDAVLRISEIESGARRASFDTVDFSALVENVCDVYCAVAEDSGRRLTARVAPDLTIRGDRDLLTQMLSNLIENALRHTPGRTTVDVRLQRREHATQLVVSDNGPGIPVEEHEHVFRRFYRLDHSRSTPGSGLGLSLVSAVVRLHAATVRLEDNEPGLRVCMDFRGGQTP